MWDLIINPFITALTFLYSLFGNNIVLAIAVFTVIIRLLTSPLMMTQQRSAKAMQELQPKLKKIQEKYKNDREKLSQAQMALYKEHGINPLGGCLPLFIQLPILLGLYQAIILALAGTPYQLMGLSGRLLVPGLDHLVPLNNMWIGMDLTKAPSANPSYALAFPVLVMTTTWLQSKLTMPAPAKSDDDTPNQAANMTKSMTTIMPLMFGFFSLSFSVGISVYFVVSNLVGIVQYTLMGKAEWGQLLGRFAGSKDEAGKAKAPAVVEGKTTPVTADGKGQSAVSGDGGSKGAGGESLPPKRKKKARKMKKKAPGSAN
jgi:YidC/Oxa1 family membrane protein insertase